ncbi:MAG: ribbon-helix-helix protein, CopG family [Acidimicrobiaceae bacterium]|nr:ribbon-helix-helix protein, CopG family [Acidimicrobiaceae bacterium]MXZ98493.1 ribbon-helix-helix protein, CopG family [Acidimicrobiaceae bacterium]MYE75975.1 ribbon-helix-helix protein, CopG family [Acidimicrobiaceae bacterium]MYE98261.1 ribbon-helix-helix protein, CopG family [Acidimicrobiaceae bacterium]MYH44535.1 ribbon-helix-helix protein, CopG family [Acidimicrobiaceae bacterium]
MVRTQISITDEQAERLRAEATARRVSQAAIVRQALDDHLARESLAARVERARASFGAFRSGCGDLAENHDAYLEEAFAS